MSAFVGELDRIQTAEEASPSDVASWFLELRTAVISLGAAAQPSNHCASVRVHVSRVWQPTRNPPTEERPLPPRLPANRSRPKRPCRMTCSTQSTTKTVSVRRVSSLSRALLKLASPLSTTFWTSASLVASTGATLPHPSLHPFRLIGGPVRAPLRWRTCM